MGWMTPTTTMRPHPTEREKLERAVIEAARDWWAYGPWSKEHDDAKIALCKAVEALEEAVE